MKFNENRGINYWWGTSRSRSCACGKSLFQSGDTRFQYCSWRLEGRVYEYLLEQIEEINRTRSFSNPKFHRIYQDWLAHQQDLLQKANVQLVHGQASFLNERTINVITPSNHEFLLTSEKIIIANGSRPIFPENMKPNGRNIFSYQNLMEMNSLLLLLSLLETVQSAMRL